MLGDLHHGRSYASCGETDQATALPAALIADLLPVTRKFGRARQDRHVCGELQAIPEECIANFERPGNLSDGLSAPTT
jgi:hypothetical protein